jgi:type 1 glutamine amidotransferase
VEERKVVVKRIGHRVVAISAVGLACALSVGAAAAMAADTSAPILRPAAFSSPPDGNNGWRITKPQTLELSATDDVAVATLQYSLDGGQNYIDVAILPGSSVSASIPLSLEGNTTLRYRAIDSSGNISRGATTNTTLNQAAAAGATAIRLQSTTGRSAGDELLIDTGAAQETATIDTIVTPAPPAPAPNVTLKAPLANAHAAGAPVAATSLFGTITAQIDTQGPVATWATQATTLQATSAAANAPGAVPGDTSLRLASTAGRAVGDVLVLDQADNAETVEIASIVSPAPPAPAPNVTLSAPVQKLHLAGSAVYVPSIVDGKVMQSRTLTPLRTDPRRRDATDTVANGAGGAAIRRMTVDGEQVIPFPLALNELTVGRHSQSVSLQDVAGSVAKYTNTFVVTTSFDDLALVIDQYADNALRTTLNGASAVGATSLRLQTPFGFRAGQTIVIDSGENQETVTIAKALSPPPTLNTTLSAAASAGDTEVRLASYTTSDSGGPNAPSNNGPIAGQPIVLDTGANLEVVTVERHITPVPPAPAPNVVLSAPLAKDHVAGTPTNLSNVILSEPLEKAHAGGVAVINPRPRISDDAASELKDLLAQAEAAAQAGNRNRAITTLNRFNATVLGRLTPAEGRATERAALSSAAEALIDQVNGVAVDTRGTGVEVGPADDGAQAIRAFWNPSPFMANPEATYKVLVNGRAGGFRHQSIVDFEALIQELGNENAFDVDVWDPNIGASPGRQAPAGVSLPTSPFMNLETLKQYKTIVFNSTVGRGAQALNAIEFANLQQYVRDGGGVVAIHGATDSMQNVPWYMDLVGAGFTNHGSNAGGILIDTESGGHVELVNADPSHPATNAVPDRFVTVEEVYNLNRDPVELGIVHPLMYENEDTLVGQIGYGPGALMNTDRHAMTWCRNFDGGRSFTTVLGHNWQFALQPWWQKMLLSAIEWTAGQEYANCVSFSEVSELIDAAAAAGDLDADAETRLDGLLSEGRAQFDGNDYVAAASTFRNLVNAIPAGSDALDDLAAKGEELVAWAKGLR